MAHRKKDIDKIVSAVRIHLHALLITDIGHRFHEGKEWLVQMTSVASKVIPRHLQVQPVGHWLWYPKQNRIADSITMRLGGCSSPSAIWRHTIEIQSGMISITQPYKYLHGHRVRAKVNAGSEEFKVIGTNPPAFLYEDPDKYDPKNALSRFMRGYFLMRVRRSGSTEASTNLITVFTCYICRAKDGHESEHPSRQAFSTLSGRAERRQ